MDVRTALLMLLTFVVAPALAGTGSADVCYAPKVLATEPDLLASSIVLACPIAGSHTLPELAEAGWSIVAVQPVIADSSVDPKTAAPVSHSAWMIVIQKGVKP